MTSAKIRLLRIQQHYNSWKGSFNATIGDKIIRTFLTFFELKKGEKCSFPSPTSSMQIVLLFEQPVGNNKHPNFKWRGQWGWGGVGSGRGLWTVFYSPKLPLFRTVSQQFYRLLYFISGEFPLLFFFFFPDR